MSLSMSNIANKTDIAKTALSTGVAITTAGFTQAQLEEHTNLEEDGTTVQIVSGVVGQYVAYKLRPVTDTVVDKTISGARRVFRRNAKTETETAPES